MIMIDRSRRLAEPLLSGRREKAVVGTLLVCVALAVIALGVYAATSGAPARADCIEVTFASTTGAATLHACGGQARRVCASPHPGPDIAEALRSACRRAGFPFTGPA